MFSGVVNAFPFRSNRMLYGEIFVDGRQYHTVEEQEGSGHDHPKKKKEAKTKREREEEEDKKK